MPSWQSSWGGSEREKEKEICLEVRQARSKVREKCSKGIARSPFLAQGAKPLGQERRSKEGERLADVVSGSDSQYVELDLVHMLNRDSHACTKASLKALSDSARQRRVDAVSADQADLEMILVGLIHLVADNCLHACEKFVNPLGMYKLA